MHEGPLAAASTSGHDPGGAAGREEPAGQPLDALGRGPLAHAHQHRAAAQDEDVAALGGGRAVGRALGPDLERRVGEVRVPAVDRLVVDRLPHPGPLAHRVDRDAVVDPGRGVAGEEVVRQRRQEQVVEAERLHHHRGRLGHPLEQLALGHAADEVRRRARRRPSRRTRGAGCRAPSGRRRARRATPPGCTSWPPGSRASRRAARSSRCTRTPRSRSVSANASCSCLACLTHSTSSKRYSSWLVGVSRLSSRSGRCRIACLQAADLGVHVQRHDHSLRPGPLQPHGSRRAARGPKVPHRRAQAAGPGRTGPRPPRGDSARPITMPHGICARGTASSGCTSPTEQVVDRTRPAPGPDDTPAGTRVGLALPALIALVVGSMIGSGIFALPSQMAGSAAAGPLLIGWLITGTGMLMLAFVFQTLAQRKPEVTAVSTATPTRVSAATSASRRPGGTGSAPGSATWPTSSCSCRRSATSSPASRAGLRSLPSSAPRSCCGSSTRSPSAE